MAFSTLILESCVHNNSCVTHQWVLGKAVQLMEKGTLVKTNKQNFSKIRIEADTGVCAVMCVLAYLLTLSGWGAVVLLFAFDLFLSLLLRPALLEHSL